MPSPCPRCQRPIPDSRKACLYCGTEVSSHSQENVLPSVPERLDSNEAVSKLVAAATQALERRDELSCGQLMARLFRQLPQDALRSTLNSLTTIWSRSMLQAVGLEGSGEANLRLREALEASESGHFREAAEAFLQARRVYHRLPSAHPMALMLSLGADCASKQIEAEIRREPRVTELLNLALRKAFSEDQKLEALPLLKETLALLNPAITSKDIKRVEDIQKSIAALESLSVSADPTADLPPEDALDPAGWAALGEQLKSTQAAQARICFQRAAEGAPENGAYWLHLANACTMCGAPAEATIHAFRNAAARLPEDLIAWTGLAASLQEDARYDEALPAWDKVIALAPGINAPSRQKAFCLEAKAFVGRCQNHGAVDWLREGIAFAKTSRWDLADVAYTHGLKVDPTHLHCRLGLGQVNYQWGVELKAEGSPSALMRFQIARDQLKLALAQLPGNETILEVMALCDAELKPRT